MPFDTPEYKAICHKLGYKSDVHFVEVRDDGTITFTSGKPDEVLGLYRSVLDHGMKPARSLIRTVQEQHFGLSEHEAEGFCFEHGCYDVECGHLGHGVDYDPEETL